MATGLNEVLLLTAGLAEPLRQRILTDFTAARTHLVYVMDLKLALFTSTPHQLLSLAHPDLEKARLACANAYSMAVASNDRGCRLHHITEQLCFSSSDLNAQFLAFIGGASLDGCPELAQLRARWRLIPIVETFIESRHRDMKMEGKRATRTSPSGISLRLRSGEIERMIKSRPATLLELADLGGPMRSMDGLLFHLDLALHPTIVDAMVRSGLESLDTLFRGHRNHPLVEAVVYRKDLGTQFRDVKGFVDFSKPDSGRKLRRSELSDSCWPIGSAESVYHTAAASHFYHRSSGELFYSFADAGTGSLPPMLAALNEASRSLQVLRSAGGCLTDEQSHLDGGTAALDLQHGNAGAMEIYTFCKARSVS